MSEKIILKYFSFRFAEEVLNSKLVIKNEILSILQHPSINIPELSRPKFNEVLRNLFIECSWENQPPIFDDIKAPSARLDFLKDRVGVEVAFTHESYIGIDLLKFQVSSYSALNKIDIGVYIVTTKEFQKKMKRLYDKTWASSLSFEKVTTYLPHFKSAIQVPIFVIGIDL